MTKTNDVGVDERVAEIIDRGQASFQQLLVVFLCLVFNALDGFDITAMAIVATAVSSELGLASEQVGAIFAFALAGMMAGAMFLAPLSDILGRRKLIIVSLLVIGGSVLLTAHADTLTEFIVLRFISGAGAGAMLASQATLAAEYSPERYRSLSVVAVTAGYPLGAMFTAVAAQWIMPEYGWRGMFWFGGGLTALMSLVALALLPESLKYLIERRPKNALIRANKILGKLNKPLLNELPVTRDGRTAGPGLVGTFLSLFEDGLAKITLTIWSAFFLGFLSLYFLMSWLPTVMEMAGYTVEVGRQAFFLFNLGGVIGIMLLGILSVRLPLTHLILVLMSGSGLLMVVFGLLEATQGLRLGLIFVIGIMLQGGFTGMYSAAAKAYPTKNRSTGIGWAIGLGRFGAVVGPYGAGVLIGSGVGLQANFLIFALPMVIAGFIAFSLRIR